MRVSRADQPREIGSPMASDVRSASSAVMRTTTGSKHLLEVNGQRILLECGMFQGRRKKTLEYNSNLPFEADSIDAGSTSAT